MGKVDFPAGRFGVGQHGKARNLLKAKLRGSGSMILHIGIGQP